MNGNYSRCNFLTRVVVRWIVNFILQRWKKSEGRVLKMPSFDFSSINFERKILKIYGTRHEFESILKQIFGQIRQILYRIFYTDFTIPTNPKSASTGIDKYTIIYNLYEHKFEFDRGRYALIH